MHICDNKKCVNPNHLRLGTQKENVVRGVNQWNSILDEKTVKHIKRLNESGIGATVIARELGFDRSTIQKIIDGKNWSHIK